MREKKLPSQTLPHFQQYLLSRKLVPEKSVTIYAYSANRYLKSLNMGSDAIANKVLFFLSLSWLNLLSTYSNGSMASGWTFHYIHY